MALLSVEGADTLRVKQTRIPILIDRKDNVLFYIRLQASESKQLDEIRLRFTQETDMKAVKAVRLWYGGTEAPQHRNPLRYAPCNMFPVMTVAGHGRPIPPIR